MRQDNNKFFFHEFEEKKFQIFVVGEQFLGFEVATQAAGDSSSKKSFRTEPPSDFQIGTDALPEKSEKSLFLTNDTSINSYDVPALYV